MSQSNCTTDQLMLESVKEIGIDFISAHHNLLQV